MNFDAWLHSKKIDANAFKSAEKRLFEEWAKDFEQMHPNSFTLQKLNLINPIRRKYQLKVSVEHTGNEATEPSPPKPVAKPMMKPKPRIN